MVKWNVENKMNKESNYYFKDLPLYNTRAQQDNTLDYLPSSRSPSLTVYMYTGANKYFQWNCITDNRFILYHISPNL